MRWIVPIPSGVTPAHSLRGITPGKRSGSTLCGRWSCDGVMHCFSRCADFLGPLLRWSKCPHFPGENCHAPVYKTCKEIGQNIYAEHPRSLYRWILMKFNRLIGLLAAFALIIPMVSAGSIESGNNETALDLPRADGFITREYYTITQGETDSYSCSVPVGTSTLQVDLNWFTDDYSLRLDIYRPDGSLYGSYHDDDDGRKPDGRIYIGISNPASGLWKFKVYGERVTGTQLYAFSYF